MNGYSSILIRVSPTLGSESVGLVRRVTCINVTILQHNCGISKDEINCTIYVTFPIELPLEMDIEGVLVSFQAAPVKYREIGPRTKGHGSLSSLTHFPSSSLLLYSKPTIFFSKISNTKILPKTTNPTQSKVSLSSSHFYFVAIFVYIFFC